MSKSVDPWQRVDDAFVLHVTGLMMRMTQLALLIVLAVVLAGGLAVAILISLNVAGFQFPARIGIVVVAVLLAIPLCFLIFKAFRAKAIEYRISLSPTHLTVRSAGGEASFALETIRLLRVRSSTDYARLVVIAQKQKLSLLTGLNKSQLRPENGASLAPIPAEYEAYLARQGFTATRTSRAADMVTFRRV